MSDNKKLIDKMDDLINHVEHELKANKATRVLFDADRLSMLTEIKGILEQPPKVPDDNLVDDLIHASFNYHKSVEFKSVTKERIRKLL